MRTASGSGTPLATGESEGECGAAGPFLLEVGISSSYHIAKFFGLTFAGLRYAASANRVNAELATFIEIVLSKEKLEPAEVVLTVLGPSEDSPRAPKIKPCSLGGE